MNILVTGAAGFIGFHTCRRLLDEGHTVIGFDNLNDYYSVSLKRDRLNLLRDRSFTFVKGDLSDKEALSKVFSAHTITHVVNYAAQAGVRYSLENPDVYVQSNLVGFANLLEMCWKAKIRHLVFASSSSVYGLNRKTPYSVHDNVDHPVSLYAATKKSNELMAHVYSHLYGLPCTGLRFFTVYGPWGRPDMSPFIFTNALLRGLSIRLYNGGDMHRDFTYIDDIVSGVCGVLTRPPVAQDRTESEMQDPSVSTAPWRILNIGNRTPIPLIQFVTTLEEITGKKADIEFLPMQPGDVKYTCADTKELEELTGFKSETSIFVGLRKYVEWFREYYGI